MGASAERTHTDLNTPILPFSGAIDRLEGDISLAIKEPLVPKQLSQLHYELLVKSGISNEIIQERGYRTLTSPAELKAFDPRFTGEAAKDARFPVLAYPVRRLGTDEIYCWVIRPDNPRTSKKTDKTGTDLVGEGKTLKLIKYEWPSGVPPICDVLPRHKDALADPTVPLYFTEGARKADAIASCGGVAVDLSGVYGFRGGNEMIRAVRRSCLTSSKSPSTVAVRCTSPTTATAKPTTRS